MKDGEERVHRTTDLFRDVNPRRWFRKSHGLLLEVFGTDKLKQVMSKLIRAVKAEERGHVPGALLPIVRREGRIAEAWTRLFWGQTLRWAADFVRRVRRALASPRGEKDRTPFYRSIPGVGRRYVPLRA